MSALPRHREQDWKLALDNCRKNLMQGEPRFLEMDIVWDLNTQFNFNTTVTKIVAGDVVRKKLFSETVLLLLLMEKQLQSQRVL